jgi:hypothetical protein
VFAVGCAVAGDDPVVGRGRDVSMPLVVNGVFSSSSVKRFRIVAE